MAVREASTGGAAPTLQDFERYTATIAAVELGEVKEPLPGQDGSGGQPIKVVLSFDGAEGELWQFVPFAYASGRVKLGINTSTGEPSRLRAFLNGVAGRDPRADLSWVDDESWAFGLGDETWRIVPGQTQIGFLGEHKQGRDGQTRYRVTRWFPAGSAVRRSTTSHLAPATTAAAFASPVAPARAPERATVSPDEVPF